MQKATIHRKVPVKKARILKASDSPIVVTGTTKTQGRIRFSFTPVSGQRLLVKKNNAYQYFTID